MPYSAFRIYSARKSAIFLHNAREIGSLTAMENRYLIKFGELALRKANLGQYIKALRTNIRRELRGTGAEVLARDKRMYVTAATEHDALVRQVLDHTFGIAGYAPVIAAEKSVEALTEATLRVVQDAISRSDVPVQSFRISARRSDKSFPLNSYEIGCDLGSAVLARFPALHVDLDEPGITVSIEVRERAYVYSRVEPGLRGLPVGVSGKGLLLLSGGIDSPIAGYLMAKRGLKIYAVHFHTFPVTSLAAQQKAQMLGRLISPWTGNIQLYNVPIFDIQKRIQERARVPEYTLLFRAAMMRIASDIARDIGALALVTGESLGQVASQTPEGMRFTGSFSDYPVMRPLIAWDKEEIMTLAKKLGTYRTSVMPFQDCCALFAPDHPLIHPEQEPMLHSYSRLEMEPLIEEARARAQVHLLEPLPSPRVLIDSEKEPARNPLG